MGEGRDSRVKGDAITETFRFPSQEECFNLLVCVHRPTLRGVVVVLVVHLSCNHDAIMMQSGRPVNRCQYFFSLLNPCFPALFRACLDFRGRERPTDE